MGKPRYRIVHERGEYYPEVKGLLFWGPVSVNFRGVRFGWGTREQALRAIAYHKELNHPVTYEEVR